MFYRRLAVTSFLSVVLFSVPVWGQSSSRALPTVLPAVDAVPQGQQSGWIPQAQQSYPQAQPSQTLPTQVQAGSSTRQGTPMEGSATRAVPTSQPASGMRSPPVMTFEDKLWGYILRAKYRNWAPVPGKSDAMYEGQSPHGAYLKMYLNRKAAGNPAELPNGSIVIKENYTPSNSLAAITLMYKAKGYNPKAGDWYWIKYNPDGSVANKTTEQGVMQLGGRVGGCIDCHGDAEGGDYTFFND